VLTRLGQWEALLGKGTWRVLASSIVFHVEVKNKLRMNLSSILPLYQSERSFAEMFSFSVFPTKGRYDGKIEILPRGKLQYFGFWFLHFSVLKGEVEMLVQRCS